MEENTLKNVDNQTENLSKSLENEKKKIVINIKKVYLTSLIWSLGLSFVTIIVLYLITFKAYPLYQIPVDDVNAEMTFSDVQIQSFFGNNEVSASQFGYEFMSLSEKVKEDILTEYIAGKYTWTKNFLLIDHIRHISIWPYLLIFVAFFQLYHFF